MRGGYLPGTYALSGLTVRNRAGTTHTLNAGDLQARGFPTSFVVATTTTTPTAAPGGITGGVPGGSPATVGPTATGSPFQGYKFAPNASGAIPAGFTRYGATVSDAATGAPISGACVYTGPPTSCPAAGVDQTDASGFFCGRPPIGELFRVHRRDRGPRRSVGEAELVDADRAGGIRRGAGAALRPNTRPPSRTGAVARPPGCEVGWRCRRTQRRQHRDDARRTKGSADADGKAVP